MRRNQLSRFLLLCTVFVLALAIASCGSQEAEAPPSNQPASDSAPATAVPAQVAADAPAAAASDAPSEALEEAQGIDLTAVNVCELLPVAEIEAVVGALRDGSPKETISIDREKGCQYIDDANGQFFEITLYPLDHWGLVKYTLNEAAPLEGVGDGAYTGAYSDAAVLEVLVKDRAVIGVRASDESQQTALALYEIALKHLP